MNGFIWVVILHVHNCLFPSISNLWCDKIWQIKLGLSAIPSIIFKSLSKKFFIFLLDFKKNQNKIISNLILNLMKWSCEFIKTVDLLAANDFMHFFVLATVKILTRLLSLLFTHLIHVLDKILQKLPFLLYLNTY